MTRGEIQFTSSPCFTVFFTSLESLGYGIGTVNAMTDANLLERMRVSKLPSIVAIVEGRILHYRGSMTRKFSF